MKNKTVVVYCKSLHPDWATCIIECAPEKFQQLKSETSGYIQDIHYITKLDQETNKWIDNGGRVLFRDEFYMNAEVYQYMRIAKRNIDKVKLLELL